MCTLVSCVIGIFKDIFNHYITLQDKRKKPHKKSEREDNSDSTITQNVKQSVVQTTQKWKR